MLSIPQTMNLVKVTIQNDITLLMGSIGYRLRRTLQQTLCVHKIY